MSDCLNKLLAFIMALVSFISVMLSGGAINDSIYTVPEGLINKNATENTVQLYDFLRDNYGKRVFTGQYLNEYIDMNSGKYNSVLDVEDLVAVHSIVNDYPAVLGVDLSGFETGNFFPPSISQALEWNKMGGIVTITWHWIEPKYRKSFYTKDTPFDFKTAMNGSDPDGYNLLVNDIDKIASQLKILADLDIPVLWRPLHEASGGWFWWGSGGANSYLQLWRLMFDRLTNYHGLNNLIWVWNGQNKEWYPGDNYVDIIGEDTYPGKMEYSLSTSMKPTFAKATKYRKNTNKMIAMSENNYVPDIDKMWETNSKWLFYATWCREFVNDMNGNYVETYTSKEHLRKVYADERTVALSDLENVDGKIRLKAQ